MAGRNGGFARDPVALEAFYREHVEAVQRFVARAALLVAQPDGVLVLGISIAAGPVGACHPAPASTAPASPSPSPSPSQLQPQPVPTPKVGQHRTG